MLGVTPLQSTTGTGANLVTGVTIGTYANGAGWRKLRPALTLSGLNGAATSITVRLRNTTDGADLWSTGGLTKGVATDTFLSPQLPSFMAASGKSYALVVTSSNASDTTNPAWAIGWFDDQQADAIAWLGVAPDALSGGKVQTSVQAIAAAVATAIANEVETQIIDDTDSEKVLEAIVNKINAMTDLDALTLSAIASAVRSNLAIELARIDDTISSRSTFADGGNVTVDDATAQGKAAIADATRLELAAELAARGVTESTINGTASDALAAKTAAQSTLANLVTLAAKFTGITALGNWLRAMARKSTPDATAIAELNTSGGTYDPSTDSAEAAREKLDTGANSDAIDEIISLFQQGIPEVQPGQQRGVYRINRGDAYGPSDRELLIVRVKNAQWPADLNDGWAWTLEGAKHPDNDAAGTAVAFTVQVRTATGPSRSLDLVATTNATDAFAEGEHTFAIVGTKDGKEWRPVKGVMVVEP